MIEQGLCEKGAIYKETAMKAVSIRDGGY